MYDLHVKKDLLGNGTALEFSPGSFHLLQKQNMQCQGARTLLCSRLGVLQDEGPSTEPES